MHHKQYQAHNQGNVNKRGGYVKCEEPKQPENDQNCGDYPQHFFISSLLSAGTSAISSSQSAAMPHHVRENNVQAAH
jgi:hypothetical protein